MEKEKEREEEFEYFKELEKKYKEFAEEFRKLSFKEKCKISIFLIVATAIVGNTLYILGSIIEGKDIDIYFSKILETSIIALVVGVLFIELEITLYRIYRTHIKPRIAARIAEIQHKYGISDFTLFVIIIVFFVMVIIWNVVLPIITGEPLHIDRLVFGIFFGILLLFILKKIETV